jgi:hypothetical protein
MERTNLRRTRTPELEAWWRRALELRTSGFDRLLAAAPGSPTLAELRRDEVRAPVFVHELSRCRAGAALDYLAAVQSEWRPVLAEYQHRPVGLYEVLLTDREVLTIWATDPASHCALHEAAVEGRDPRISTWRAHAREFLTDWREELMTPHPNSLLSAGDPL